jgi:hypothetical protein
VLLVSYNEQLKIKQRQKSPTKTINNENIPGWVRKSSEKSSILEPTKKKNTDTEPKKKRELRVMAIDGNGTLDFVNQTNK